MKELSIFVDVSGDFGKYNTKYAPQYIFTMVFPDLLYPVIAGAFPDAFLFQFFGIHQLPKSTFNRTDAERGK